MLLAAKKGKQKEGYHERASAGGRALPSPHLTIPISIDLRCAGVVPLESMHKVCSYL